MNRSRRTSLTHRLRRQRTRRQRQHSSRRRPKSSRRRCRSKRISRKGGGLNCSRVYLARLARKNLPDKNPQTRRKRLSLFIQAMACNLLPTSSTPSFDVRTDMLTRRNKIREESQRRLQKAEEARLAEETRLAQQSESAWKAEPVRRGLFRNVQKILGRRTDGYNMPGEGKEESEDDDELPMSSPARYG